MVIAKGKLYGLYTIYKIGGAGLFEVNLDGSNLKLFPEYNTTPNGVTPTGLLLASDGNLWVSQNLPNNLVALSLSTGTVLKTLKPFSTNAAVGAPPAALLQVKDGTLWGTTTMFGKVSAGHFGDGVVYNLNAVLPPR
jgi:streptogramin lyase